MLEVKNLTKRYGDKKAVNDISFTVSRGEILGFLGPNGAGKSTTMNMITGYLASTSGSIRIDGIDILTDPIKAKKKIGYLPEKPPLYMDMTVEEYLNFMYELKKVRLPRRQHLEEICRRVRIQDVYRRVIKNLSKGYRQRVGVAQALLGNPELLILDEPTVGLDPNQIIEMRQLVKDLGRTQTVILSSHILSEIQLLCERVIVMNRGTIVADDTTEAIARSLSNDHRLNVTIEGNPRAVRPLLEKLDGVEKAELLRQRGEGVCEYVVEVEENCDIRREMFLRLAENHFPLLESRPSEMSLEEIFLNLTSGKNQAGGTK